MGMFYQDEAQMRRVYRRVRGEWGATGCKRGDWMKLRMKYHYKSLPVLGAVVYDCKETGYKAINSARIWGKRNNAKFISRITPEGFGIWRIA